MTSMKWHPGYVTTRPSKESVFRTATRDGYGRQMVIFAQDDSWFLGCASQPAGDDYPLVLTWHYWEITEADRIAIHGHMMDGDALARYLDALLAAGSEVTLRVYRDRIVEDMPSSWSMFPPASAWPPGMDKVDVREVPSC